MERTVLYKHKSDGKPFTHVSLIITHSHGTIPDQYHIEGSLANDEEIKIMVYGPVYTYDNVLDVYYYLII